MENILDIYTTILCLPNHYSVKKGGKKTNEQNHAESESFELLVISKSMRKINVKVSDTWMNE